MSDRRDSVFQEAKTFSPHCCCCGWVEHCLLNYQCCGTCCGVIFYVPFMTILYFLWILQIPITILVNLLSFVFCCDFCKCECCRGSLFIADDDSVPEAHDSVMLYTAESIRNLHLQQSAMNDDDDDQQEEVNQMSPSGSGGGNKFEQHLQIQQEQQQIDSVSYRSNDDEDGDKSTVTILNWNVFGQLGRYWKRYSLLATQINDLNPDIICIQEAVTVKWFVMYIQMVYFCVYY